MNNTRWITEASSKKTGLPVGTPMVKSPNQADVYRILAQGEVFYTPVVRGHTSLYGINPFDVSELDPLSREVAGPWVHTLEVMVDYDKLPTDTPYKVRTNPIVGTIRSETHVCIDTEHETEYGMKEIAALLERHLGAMQKDKHHVILEGELTITGSHRLTGRKFTYLNGEVTPMARLKPQPF